MSRVDEVITRLEGLEELLRCHAVLVWPDAIRRVRVNTSNDPLLLKRSVLAMYKGTMGSLTDLMIARVNGHSVDDESAANRTLDQLRHELWELARAL